MILAESIEIPTLTVEERHRPLAESIRALASQTDNINVLRPIHAAINIRTITRQRRNLETPYKTAIEDVLGRTAQPVSGPGFAMATSQSWSVALGLTTFFRLNSDWNHLGAALDRKMAFATASFSLYVALISLLATTTFGWLSLPPSRDAKVSQLPESAAQQRDAPDRQQPASPPVAGR